ncbi:MAG: hypothetical protein ACRDNE_06155 [Gaiellaceae bacterium]
MRGKPVRIAPLSLLLLVALIVAPAASAKELQANVVSMPSDLVAGEAVPVVFEVYVLEEIAEGEDIEHPVDVSGLSLVVSSADSSLERRAFRAEVLGSGRYRAEIVFPAVGGWSMDVETNDGHEPFALGKGAVSVSAPGAEEREAAPTVAAGTTRGFFLPLGLAGGALLLTATGLEVRRRRLRRPH